MTTTEKEFIVMFLRELSEEMGRAGCNDLDLNNTPENVKVINDALAANGETWEQPPHVSDKTFSAPCGDFGLVDYLANALDAEIKLSWTTSDDAPEACVGVTGLGTNPDVLDDEINPDPK